MAEIPNIKTDEICDDPKIAEVKEKQMKQFRKHSMLNSIGETFKFLAGVLTTIGMAIAIPEFVVGLKLAAEGAGFIATLGAGAGAVGILGVGLLAAAAVATSVAIFSTYKASNIWAGGQFNNYEISAKSTAHHIAQELHVDNPSPFENVARADGKSWSEVARVSKTTSEMRVRV